MESSEFFALIERGDAAAVARAIEDGMSVDTTDLTDNPAIIMAAMFGHEDVVKVLLDAGADPNARGWAGGTPLMVCSGLKCFETLLAAGADPSLQDDDCETALSKCKESFASLEAMQEAIDGGHMEGTAGQYWPPSEEALTILRRLEELSGQSHSAN